MVVVRAVALAGLLLSSLLVFVPSGGAQAAPEALYFTAEEGSAPANLFPQCDATERLFLLSPVMPADGKAYTGTSNPGLACSTYLTYTYAAPALVSGKTTLDLYFACDLPTPYATPATLAFRIILTKNGDELGRYETSAPATCDSSPDQFTGEIGTDGTAFAAGDVLAIQAVVWHAGVTGGVEDNAHFVVGPAHPSRVEAVGLLGASHAEEAPAAAQAILENLTAPAFLHEFENATSDDYTFNFTVPWQNATLRQTAEVVGGSANVTVYRDGEVFLSVLLTNQTAPPPAGNGTGAPNGTGNGTADNRTEDLPVLTDAAGNWSIVIDYEAFVGTLGLELAEFVPAPADGQAGNQTEEPVLDADASSEDAPGPALPLLVLGVLAVAFVRRRR